MEILLILAGLIIIAFILLIMLISKVHREMNDRILSFGKDAEEDNFWEEL